MELLREGFMRKMWVFVAPMLAAGIADLSKRPASLFLIQATMIRGRLALYDWAKLDWIKLVEPLHPLC
jgi:hypothetical protein